MGRLLFVAKLECSLRLQTLELIDPTELILPLLKGSVALGYLLNFSELQFPHL